MKLSLGQFRSFGGVLVAYGDVPWTEDEAFAFTERVEALIAERRAEARMAKTTLVPFAAEFTGDES